MSCAECFKGVAHDGKPAGTEDKIHGLRTYIAHPLAGPTSPSTIIFVTDAFGFNLLNSKLLADEYAAKTGCRVLVPDVIPGGGVPLNSLELMECVSSSVGWFDILGQARRIIALAQMMTTFGSFALRTRGVFPTILAYTRAVKAELPTGSKLGVAGFCWGAMHTTKLSCEPDVEGASMSPLVDAHFAAHPSGLKVPDDFVKAVETFGVPLSIAVGDRDMLLSKDTVLDLETKLKQSSGGNQPCFEVVLYPDCGHGFAVRADQRKTSENEAAVKASQQAIDWFRKHLS